MIMMMIIIIIIKIICFTPVFMTFLSE